MPLLKWMSVLQNGGYINLQSNNDKGIRIKKKKKKKK